MIKAIYLKITGRIFHLYGTGKRRIGIALLWLYHGHTADVRPLTSITLRTCKIRATGRAPA